MTNLSIENGFCINSSIINFVDNDESFGDNDDDNNNNNNPKSLYISKLELIKNALRLESISFTFLINSKPLISGICKSEMTSL